MKWLKRLGVVLAVLVALVALVAVLVRLDDYIPVVEKEVSARIGEPVSIKHLHVAVLPVPHARADDITIGGADRIHVARLILIPELWSLLREEKVIRSIELEDLTLPHQALGAIAALTQADRRAGKIRVKKIRLTNAVVKLEKSTFGPFDVDVQVSATGAQAGHLTLKTRDGKLSANLTPQDAHYRLEIAARGWTPPLGPPLVFDELNVQGLVRAKGAELDAVQATIYGGTVSGKAAVAWDKGIAVKGNLDVKRVELRDVLATVSRQARLSGKVDAKPAFSSHARTTAELGDELKVDTPFTVHQAVLHGIDLMKAAATLGRSSSGGDTRLDQLAGQLRIEGRTYRISELRISSGPLAVRGNLQVSASRALSGRVNANAGGLGGLAGVPLTISGTVDSPQIAPDARALAAAAAGTALLGPGLGTAAGAKLGNVVEGLFGDRRKR
jgi:uncharacterized protein involved in outer membrane biogenesis